LIDREADELGDATLGGARRTQSRIELVNDRFLGRDHCCDLKARNPAYIINGKDVQWIGHCQEELVLQARNRDNLMSVRQFTRDQIGNFQRNADSTKVDGGRVEHAAHRNGHVLLAYVRLLENQLEQPGALLFLLLEQLIDLARAEQTVLDECVGDAFSKCFYWRHILAENFAKIFYEVRGRNQIP
jgi:hypothetical protein